MYLAFSILCCLFWTLLYITVIIELKKTNNTIENFFTISMFLCLEGFFFIFKCNDITNSFNGFCYAMLWYIWLGLDIAITILFLLFCDKKNKLLFVFSFIFLFVILFFFYHDNTLFFQFYADMIATIIFIFKLLFFSSKFIKKDYSFVLMISIFKIFGDTFAYFSGLESVTNNSELIHLTIISIILIILDIIFVVFSIIKYRQIKNNEI